jgi:hypothetical protein
LSGVNQGNIYLSPLTSTTSFGVGKAQLVVNMESYPVVVSAAILNFNATILGSVVPKISN